MTKVKKHNIIYWEILTKYGFNLERNWFEYPQSDLDIIDDLAEAMHIKGTNGRCPGRTLWDRAKSGRPF